MAREMKDSGIEWIGAIPKSWSIHAVFQLFVPVKNKNENMQENNLLSLSYGRIIRKNINTTDGLLPENFEGYNIIEPKDIVLRLTDLQNDHTSLRVGISGQRGIITSAYLTLRNQSDCFERYLYYQLHAFDICKGFYGMGAGVRQGLNWDGIKMLKIIRPSNVEQKRIAGFLDRQCAEIDAVIERTRATIEEYRKLKQAVITEAVTKGIRGSRPMKDSGIEWIGEIPEEWEVVRIKTLFDYRNERNFLPLEEVNLISLYTDLGVVQHSDLESTTGNKASNADGYKLVYADDIVVNIILCWMGAIGRSAYAGVTSPAYDVYAPKQGTNSEFYHHLFRTKGFNGDCYKAGRGIMAMRWRTYSDQFRALKVVHPSAQEQSEIVSYLNQKCAEIDILIAKKTALLTELETYKKSLIYEYVTGKRECPSAEQQMAVIYPFYPAKVKAYSPLFGQAVLASRILDECHENIGRVKLEKILFTIEYSIGFDSNTEYQREVAGPFHPSIYKCEGIIGNRNKWFTIRESKHGVSYTPTADKDKYKPYYNKYFGEYAAEIDRIISIFKPYTIDQAEVVATLLAAWNDAIIDGKSFTDEDIVDDVLKNWHERKARYPKTMWLRAMTQMRKDNLVPKGYGKKTIKKS